MKNNKGFTLVELLAVVAILSLLVIIALPNIVSMFNDAKMNSFLTECKEIYKTGQNQWMMDSMVVTEAQTYKRCSTCTGKSLKLSGRQEIDYLITFNKAGKVTKFYATDGTYQYIYDEGDLNVENIKTASAVVELADDSKVKIENNKPYIGNTAQVDANTFMIKSYSITYEPGMTWREWIDSSYNTYGFKVENKSQTSEYNGNVHDYLLDDGVYGISTETIRYACGPNHYLTSYELLYNRNVNGYVFPSDEISSGMTYEIWGSAC